MVVEGSKIRKTGRSRKAGKLRILAAGDIHSSLDIAEKLAQKAKKEKVDLVVLAGDIHGYVDSEEDVIEPFKKVGKKVVFVPGNLDMTSEIELIKANHKIKNLDGYYVNYKGVDILGVGNPDWKLSPDTKKTIEKIAKNFDRINTRDSKKGKRGKRILVSHLHAKGTRAEFSGVEGDEGIRKAVEYFHPDLLISAHIHEAEGIEDKIGKTKVIQVGRKGRIIEI